MDSGHSTLYDLYLLAKDYYKKDVVLCRLLERLHSKMRNVERERDFYKSEATNAKAWLKNLLFSVTAFFEKETKPSQERLGDMINQVITARSNYGWDDEDGK